MSVVSIVLNWNGKPYLEQCLEDLEAQDYPDHRILVVDNGSADGSQFLIRDRYPGVELIENYVNVGFAEGNNVGVRRALEDPGVRFMALLNNDTRVPPHWIATLVGELERNPGFGAAQTALVWSHDPNRINSLGIAVEPSLWAFDDGVMESGVESYGAGEIFGVTAGACVFRREMVDDVMEGRHLFDPSFFAYYEDVDLAFRARLKGWRSLFVPGAVVQHVGSGTSGRSVHLKVYLLERNHWFYVVKNVPLRELARRLPHFLKKRVSRTTQWLRQKNLRVLIWSIRGNVAWVAWLPHLLRARRRNLSPQGAARLKAALEIRMGKAERAPV